MMPKRSQLSVAADSSGKEVKTIRLLSVCSTLWPRQPRQEEPGQAESWERSASPATMGGTAETSGSFANRAAKHTLLTGQLSRAYYLVLGKWSEQYPQSANLRASPSEKWGLSRPPGALVTCAHLFPVSVWALL